VQAFAQVLGEPIVVWDFADGITSDWQQGINSTTDLAHWEYRGPNTEPNNTVGARGTCSGLAVPIPSQTQSNGFVIFDGNYWDDSGTSCGAGIGTGTDPGPHTAWLITPSVDLSTLNGAILTFQQQVRSYQATTRVEISLDEGNNWTTILQNPFGGVTPNAVWASVDISALTAGQTNVRFKFYYSGFYYWWLLDDITIYEPNDNDLMMSFVRYTNHNEQDYQAPFVDLEYDQYPMLYLPEFNFGASATNVGYNSQTNTRLNVRIVQDGTTETYNQFTAPALVEPSEVQNLLMPNPYQHPGVLGDYKIYFNTIQDQVDETPENNKDSLDYSITDYVFARDEGPMETSYSASGIYDQYRMEAGTFYEIFESSTACHSLQVAVAEGTEINAGIYGVIYNQSLEDTLAYTDTVFVNTAFLNSVGEEKMMTLHFHEPFVLQQDSIYFVAYSQADSTQGFSIARSGVALGETGLVRFPNVNATFISPKIPMVRMNIFPVNTQAGCTDPNAMNYLPGANTNDGSCLYAGCTDIEADNYDPLANFDDDSCVIGGCFDPNASNYNPEADYNNGTCLYPGCTDDNALNYDPIFNVEDGSCLYLHPYLEVTTLSGCYPYTIHINNQNDFVENSSCSFLLNGDPINETCSAAFDYVIETPGSYELSYTFMVNNITADTTISIEVFDHPASPVLSYDVDTYTVSCSNCGENEYSWLYNGESTGISNADQPIYFDGNYQNGLYAIQIADNNGCTTLSEETLVIQPYFTTNTSEACAPFTLIAYNLSDPYPNTEYTIDFGDGEGVVAFNSNESHTYDTASSYSVMVTATNGSVSATYETTIQVNPVILPSLVHNSVTDQVECTNCDLFEEVTWTIDGVTETGPGPFPDNGTSYAITAITADGCAGNGIIVLTGIAESDEVNISLYPVPANETLYVTISDAGLWEISIFDQVGGLAMKTKATGGGSNQRIDLTGLSTGWYTINITDGVRQTTQVIQVIHP
ncbi:MAG: PKD domain-containing protein, partial [Flavobacteriales bacterium]|nr:PKD domain-containing protein [Flavobacteriales bacterium]